jgi:hypothetical protein
MSAVQFGPRPDNLGIIRHLNAVLLIKQHNVISTIKHPYPVKLGSLDSLGLGEHGHDKDLHLPSIVLEYHRLKDPTLTGYVLYETPNQITHIKTKDRPNIYE